MQYLGSKKKKRQNRLNGREDGAKKTHRQERERERERGGAEYERNTPG
jgi:hypothetical protein